jgi:uncharacterized repeat protein (TIGR03803 family)
MTPGGTVTSLVAFRQGYEQAINPLGRLLQASDGNFYGAAGGNAGVGAIFKVTPDGVLTTVGLFGAGDATGESPNGGLIEANDGNFYGTTYAGGTYCCPTSIGTVFKMTPEGQITTIVSFTDQGGPSPGAHPQAGLLQGSDGNLYGTTELDGSLGYGNVFRIVMPGPLLTSAQAGSQLILSWRTNYTGYTLQSSPDLTSGKWSVCTNPPAIVGGQFIVTNSVTGSAGYFRLKK